MIEFTPFLSLQAVAGKLDSTVTEVFSHMKQSVDRRMGAVETAMDGKMTRLAEQAKKINMNQAGSWKIPFFIITLVIIAGAIGMYIFYQKIRKMHLL